MKQTKFKTLTVLGVISGLIPIVIYTLWIYASTNSPSHMEAVELFKSFFPTWLRGRWDTTLLSIAMCILAIALCAFGLRTQHRTWRRFNRIFIIIIALLLAMNLFSMM